MGKQILYIMMFISAFWIVCEIPEPPPSAENVSLGLGFERSNGEIIKGTSLEDTTDNLIKICMYLNFTELLDSVNLRIISKTDTQKYAIDSFTQQFDTVYHSLSFSKTGNYQVNLTAYVEGKPIAVNGTITIVDRPQTAQNHAPVLTVPSSQIIGAGQTLIFTVSATDPDTNQLVTITAPKKPNTAIFKADTFKWTPTIEDTGTDTVIFIASDNYLPAKTDTEFVVINISSVRVNQSPKWSTKKIQKTIIPGELFSYELGDKCYDPDNDTLIYSIASGLPAKDTIINNIYSYTPSEADTGEYTVYITTQDPSGLEDTLTLELTVIINSVIDTIAPVFTWVSPAKDSTEISSSTIQVTVTCNDESGIDSVKCFLGTTMFNVVKSGDSTYSATVTGLLPTEWNTITFVATDASPAKNLCTLLVHLKYDNTAPSFKLSIAAGTGGKITVPVNSPVDVNYGVAKTITAAPDSGYQFVNWTITPDTAGTIASDTSASTTVTIVNANASVKANFAPITYELTMANDGNGTTTPAEGKSTVKQGAATTISAIPNPGYEFSHWTITPASAGTITSSNSASASVKLNSSNATVKAIFKIKTYSISITADNGSITLSPEQNQYDSGTVVSLKAVPVTGYEFTGWSGALTGNTNPTTIKMDGPKSITANFTIKKYSLSVAGLNGTVTKEPNLTLYDSGSTVILTAVAATGYQFSSWSGGL
ncbi:MAG: hypothetical protein GX640_19945, partial [Fibrobacter sp.]|nr:hypothetical protein [Fibrobacter sp.]